jgi:AraC family transcriptional regulator
VRPSARASVRKAELHRSRAIAARLSAYRPGLVQSPHDHDAPHASFLIAGSLEESLRAGDETGAGGLVSFRPAGVRHGVRFGPAGALILTIFPADAAGLAGAPSDAAWRPVRASAAHRRLLACLLSAGPAGEAEDLLWDVLAAAAAPTPPRAPGWLERARERMVEEPGAASIARLAAEGGVHRVHFSRLFHACFGQPPSLYRRRCMAAAAVASMLDGAGTFCAVAQDAGFADQSHMNRAVREVTGLPPRRLKALLA